MFTWLAQAFVLKPWWAKNLRIVVALFALVKLMTAGILAHFLRLECDYFWVSKHMPTRTCWRATCSMVSYKADHRPPPTVTHGNPKDLRSVTRIYVGNLDREVPPEKEACHHRPVRSACWSICTNFELTHAPKPPKVSERCWWLHIYIYILISSLSSKLTVGK